MWLWGDCFVTDAEGQLIILGSSIAISGREPSLPPSIKFYTRVPLAPLGQVNPATPAVVADISNADGVAGLRSLTTPGRGPEFGRPSWEFTGREHLSEISKKWLWPNCGCTIGNTLFLIYSGICCARVEGCGYQWDGSQWLYPIEITGDDPANWKHEERRPLNSNSPIVWRWIHDDTEDSRYIYIFGTVSTFFDTGTLYVARATPSTIRDYASWEFLHKRVGPLGFEEDWRTWRDEDVTLATLWPLATHVALEFSIDKIMVNGSPRWLLAHSYWSSKDTPPSGGLLFSGLGILRLSENGSFTSFPDDEGEENFFWIDVHDVDPEFNNGGPKFAGFFRGFSVHSELVPTSSLEAFPASKRPIVVGYTIFNFAEDPTASEAVWTKVECAEIDDGRFCGARRFAIIDLTEKILQPSKRQPPIVSQPPSLRPPIFREPIIPPPYPPPPETIGLPTRQDERAEECGDCRVQRSHCERFAARNRAANSTFAAAQAGRDNVPSPVGHGMRSLSCEQNNPDEPSVRHSATDRQDSSPFTPHRDADRSPGGVCRRRCLRSGPGRGGIRPDGRYGVSGECSFVAHRNAFVVSGACVSDHAQPRRRKRQQRDSVPTSPRHEMGRARYHERHRVTVTVSIAP